jgi:hypothetical protein
MLVLDSQLTPWTAVALERKRKGHPAAKGGELLHFVIANTTKYNHCHPTG